MVKKVLFGLSPKKMEPVGSPALVRSRIVPPRSRYLSARAVAGPVSSGSWTTKVPATRSHACLVASPMTATCRRVPPPHLRRHLPHCPGLRTHWALIDASRHTDPPQMLVANKANSIRIRALKASPSLVGRHPIGTVEPSCLCCLGVAIGRWTTPRTGHPRPHQEIGDLSANCPAFARSIPYRLIHM